MKPTAMPREWSVVPLDASHRAAVNAQICAHWTTPFIAYIDHLIDVSNPAGFVAVEDGVVTASITLRVFEDCLQVVTLVSDVEGRGVASALLVAAENEARRLGIAKVLLSVENSYLEQLGFYQRRGYVLYRLHLDVLRDLRRLKPSIPLTDGNGVPIRDQIDLVKDVQKP